MPYSTGYAKKLCQFNPQVGKPGADTKSRGIKSRFARLCGNRQAIGQRFQPGHLGSGQAPARPAPSVADNSQSTVNNRNSEGTSAKPAIERVSALQKKSTSASEERTGVMALT